MGRADGRLEVWDLVDRTHQPAVVAPVAPCALTSLSVSPQPASSSSRAPQAQLVAVGDIGGTLRLVELPRALRRRGRTETRAMAALLRREEGRLAAVARRAEARLAEQRAAAEAHRAKAAAAQSAAQRQQQQQKEKKGAKDEEVEQSPEQVYLALEAAWRAKLQGAASGAAVADR